MHTKSLCMKLECKINRLLVSLAIDATFVLLWILFTVTFSLEFADWHRCGSAILGTDHTRFSLSWWKRSAWLETHFNLEMGKWNMAARGLSLSRSLNFKVGTFKGFSPKEVKHFLSLSFSAKAKWKHGLRVNISKRSIANFFLYFWYDLAIEALYMYMKLYLVNVAANE